MKNEIVVSGSSETIDHRALYKLFVHYRQITLIRYLFTLGEEFSFDVDLFKMALDLDAYDVAALIHKEFFR